MEQGTLEPLRIPSCAIFRLISCSTSAPLPQAPQADFPSNQIHVSPVPALEVCEVRAGCSGSTKGCGPQPDWGAPAPADDPHPRSSCHPPSWGQTLGSPEPHHTSALSGNDPIGQRSGLKTRVRSQCSLPSWSKFSHALKGPSNGLLSELGWEGPLVASDPPASQEVAPCQESNTGPPCPGVTSLLGHL